MMECFSVFIPLKIPSESPYVEEVVTWQMNILLQKAAK